MEYPSKTSQKRKLSTIAKLEATSAKAHKCRYDRRIRDLKYIRRYGLPAAKRWAQQRLEAEGVTVRVEKGCGHD